MDRARITRNRRTTIDLALVLFALCGCDASGEPNGSGIAGTYDVAITTSLVNSVEQMHFASDRHEFVIARPDRDGVFTGTFAFRAGLNSPGSEGTIRGVVHADGAVAFTDWAFTGDSESFESLDWCDNEAANAADMTGTFVRGRLTLAVSAELPCTYTVNGLQVTVSTAVSQSIDARKR